MAEKLNRRLGDFSWKFNLKGTDANRWAIRLARHLTGRPKGLIPNLAYHDTAEEIQITLDHDGGIDNYELDIGTQPAPAGHSYSFQVTPRLPQLTLIMQPPSS